ncbi:RNA polymerase sigma factor [Planctomicrobium sp. SH661]|uniref:RNA polymerase sigma factor n=1 Tax=Planctomicrobium sp. SH661 TaxID=3448124 RepID=UPI003F5AE3F7
MEHAACREMVRQLVRDDYQIVYRFAYRLSGSHADAEDLTQQTFLQACRKLDQLRSQERARPWLFTIVRNCYLKSRQKQKLWELPGDEADWVGESRSAWPEEFDEEQLQLALREMPESFRTPVLLYYFEELSYKEISSVLEVPIGTVMSRLARGKELLRSRLMEKTAAMAAVRVS